MPKVFEVTMTDKSAEVLKAMKEQVALGLESIGQEAEGYAKDDVPVDTGRLRNSIAHTVDNAEQAVYIGTNVEYAPYVEYGEKATHTTGKAHFLRDAAANHGDHYRAIMEAALKS
jgi:phage gpG-like protein